MCLSLQINSVWKILDQASHVLAESLHPCPAVSSGSVVLQSRRCPPQSESRICRLEIDPALAPRILCLPMRTRGAALLTRKTVTRESCSLLMTHVLRTRAPDISVLLDGFDRPYSSTDFLTAKIRVSMAPA